MSNNQDDSQKPIKPALKLTNSKPVARTMTAGYEVSSSSSSSKPGESLKLSTNLNLNLNTNTNSNSSSTTNANTGEGPKLNVSSAVYIPKNRQNQTSTTSTTTTTTTDSSMGVSGTSVPVNMNKAPYPSNTSVFNSFLAQYPGYNNPGSMVNFSYLGQSIPNMTNMYPPVMRPINMNQMGQVNPMYMQPTMPMGQPTRMSMQNMYPSQHYKTEGSLNLQKPLTNSVPFQPSNNTSSSVATDNTNTASSLDSKKAISLNAQSYIPKGYNKVK